MRFSKFIALDIEDVVDIEPFWLILLAPKLFVLLCAESSLLCAVDTPVKFNGGPTLFLCMPSCGI